MNLNTVATAHVILDETDSTNAEARRRAGAGERGPLWIAARRQSAGRGRRGRSWEGGQGNLYATLLLTTDRPAAEAAQLSFVAALAVCDLARAYVDPAKARVKWPNDLMIGDAKAAGILLESGPAPRQVRLAGPWRSGLRRLVQGPRDRGGLRRVGGLGGVNCSR